MSLARLDKAVSQHVYESERQSVSVETSAAKLATFTTTNNTNTPQHDVTPVTDTSQIAEEFVDHKTAAERNQEMISDVKTLKSKLRTQDYVTGNVKW